VHFIEPEEIPEEEDSYYLISKGIEYDEQEAPNICHLRKLRIPKHGIGHFTLEEVNAFTHSR
jgi:hypothetical protein